MAGVCLCHLQRKEIRGIMRTYSHKAVIRIFRVFLKHTKLPR